MLVGPAPAPNCSFPAVDLDAPLGFSVARANGGGVTGWTTPLNCGEDRGESARGEPMVRLFILCPKGMGEAQDRGDGAAEDEGEMYDNMVG